MISGQTEQPYAANVTNIWPMINAWWSNGAVDYFDKSFAKG